MYWWVDGSGAGGRRQDRPAPYQAAAAGRQLQALVRPLRERSGSPRVDQALRIYWR